MGKCCFFRHGFVQVVSFLVQCLFFPCVNFFLNPFSNLFYNKKSCNLIALFFYSIHTAGHVYRGTRPVISVNKEQATIRVWAWFTSDGAGSIVLLNDLSEEQFLELLDELFVPQITARFGTRPVDFMDASISRNALPSSLFYTLRQMDYSFKLLKWPPKSSSHLSPFDEIWAHIEGTLRLQRRKPKNAAELWDYVEYIWERRSEQPGFWVGLVANITAKLRSIAAANGKLAATEKKKLCIP